MKQTILIFLFPWILMAQTEEQSYELIETRSNFEIRYYPPVMMVEYDSNESGSSGFRSLFRYISGSNNEEIKIAMTTPVHMGKKEGKSSMAFVLPKKFDPFSAPEPKEKNVRVYQSEAGFYATIRYSGYTNPNKEKSYTEKLIKLLEEEGIKRIGSAKVFVYDAPYNFINRRNEISIPIDWKQ